MFIDQVRISVRSGKGGDGCVSLHREKYRPKGGPDGGDGGRGGDVVFVVDPGRMNLLDFKWSRKFEAENGQVGGSGNRRGRSGKAIVVKVPPGTQVKNAETGELLLDMVKIGQREVLLNGGHGGKGNARFKSSTQQTPRKAAPGGEGHQLDLELELKLLADVGLVGMPNAGKSTLLSVISAARPKVADYPFTTLSPNVGIVPYAEYKSFAMADIPGLIEGAHEGRGLGHQFLRHVERTRLLVYLVDVSSEDPAGDLETLKRELERYSPELSRRPSLVVLNKSDLTTPSRRKLKLEHDFLISAAANKRVKGLVKSIGQLLEEMELESPSSAYATQFVAAAEDVPPPLEMPSSPADAASERMRNPDEEE